MSGKSSAPGPLSQDIWATATGGEKNLPIVFRFRQHMPVSINGLNDFPFLIHVRWRYDGTGNNGMPSRDDNRRQIELEDAIASLDEQDGLGYLMLVVTGNSRKEWIFYSSDIPAWLNRFNELLASHPRYPVEIETSTDQEWSTWKDVAVCAQH